MSEEVNYFDDDIVERFEISVWLCHLVYHLIIVLLDSLRTAGGQLQAAMNDEALYNSRKEDYEIKLSCGHFNYQGRPNFDVEWVVS